MGQTGFLGRSPFLGHVKEQWAPRVLGLVPPVFWHRLSDLHLVVPHWHIVGDAPVPHVSGLYRYRTLAQFTADVDFFLRQYKPVTEDEVIAHLHDGRALPRQSVLLTFDDGFRESHDVVAPLLRVKGVPAVFFLISSTLDNRRLCHPQKASLLLHELDGRQSGPVLEELGRLLTSAGVPPLQDLRDRIRSVTWRQRHVLDDLALVLRADFDTYLRVHRPYLTVEEAKTLLRQGFSIGAHSVDHPDFADLEPEECSYQVRESMRWLSDALTFQCRSFAFPYRDTGVPLRFFQQAFAEGVLKLSFGSGGLLPHFFPFNLQRFSMERTDLTACQVLSVHFARRLGRGLFSRTPGNMLGRF